MKVKFLSFLMVITTLMMNVGFMSCSSDDDDNGNPPLVDKDDVCTAMDDSKFMKWCYDNYDVNGDGKVSKIEAAAVREFTPNSKNTFSSVKGLEYFTGIEKLDIEGTFTEIDLSHMPNLTSLKVKSKVTTFNLSNNPLVSYLWIQDRNYNDKSYTLDNPTNHIIGLVINENLEAYLFGIVKIDEIDLVKAKVQFPEILIVKKLTISEYHNRFNIDYGQYHIYYVQEDIEDIIISGETYHHFKNTQLYWQTLIAVDDGTPNNIDISGAWTGDLGMSVGVEYPDGRYIEYDAIKTDIEFTPHQRYATHGEGYQIDYYDHHCPYRYTCYEFQWTIQDGVIKLRYYDGYNLNANIYDYMLDNNVFEGRLEGTGSSISFRLRKIADFYHYWNDYYSGSWSSYFYIAWDGSYYYDNGYWYGDYKESY